MFLLSFGVGIIGGTYGIGGDAMIAPFCVAVFHLLAYTVVGAALIWEPFSILPAAFLDGVGP